MQRYAMHISRVWLQLRRRGELRSEWGSPPIQRGVLNGGTQRTELAVAPRYSDGGKLFGSFGLYFLFSNLQAHSWHQRPLHRLAHNYI